jgi:glycerol uptake facilitator-like aquaporin
MATNLTSDSALRLLINAISTAVGLAVVIRIGIKVSGSHFNPAVTLIMLFIKKIDTRSSLFYISAQILGAISGVTTANFIFEQKVLNQSMIIRSGSNLFVSEVIATAVLLWIILRFPKRDDLVALYAPLWIFAGILLTSSTAFANPAITIGRVFTTSITGIAPESIFAFIVAQLIGAALGFYVARNITNPKGALDNE